MPPVRALLVALLCGLLVLSGCGGDDDEESGTNSSPATTTEQRADDQGPTKEDYIAEADTLCKESNARAKALNERSVEAVKGRSSGKEQLRALAPILREGYALQRNDMEEFEAIEPPADDREVIDRLTTAYGEQTALVGRMLDAAEATDVQRFNALQKEHQRVKTRARGLARGYGFKECGSGKNEAG